MTYHDLATIENWFHDFLPEGKIKNFKPTIISKDNCSITTWDPDDDTVSFKSTKLNDYHRKEYPKTKEKDVKHAVARTIISHKTFESWAKDKNLFHYEISMIINNMLTSLSESLGDLSRRVVKVGSPYHGTYFEQYISPINEQLIIGFEFRISVVGNNWHYS